MAEGQNILCKYVVTKMTILTENIHKNSRIDENIAIIREELKAKIQVHNK